MLFGNEFIINMIVTKGEYSILMNDRAHSIVLSIHRLTDRLASQAMSNSACLSTTSMFAGAFLNDHSRTIHSKTAATTTVIVVALLCTATDAVDAREHGTTVFGLEGESVNLFSCYVANLHRNSRPRD